MRKLLVSVLVSTLLLAGLGLAVYGQAGDQLAALAGPLVVDVRQQVPVDVTLATSVGATGTQTVTVPMVLDLNLQIGLSSALTPAVTIGEVTPARVTVSALAAQGEALVDGAGIEYNIEAPETLEIIQIQSGADSSGDFKLIGELRNIGDEALEYQSFAVSLYDADGTLIGVESTYAELEEIAPGQTSPFTLITFTPVDEVASYFVQAD